jgi:hypothetical protein
MNLENKIVLAHSGYSCRKSKDVYRENSMEACRESSNKDYIGIIELDLRKSKDGVLYCYHGTLFQYYITLKLRRNFSVVKEKYHVDTLGDILNIISEDKIIFLDIKDTSITKEDLVKIFDGRNFKEIIIGNKSVSYLSRFDGLPDVFVKILNGNIFCNFYDFDKLKNDGFKYFEAVFSFQVNSKAIKEIEKSGLMFRISGLFFRDKESYWEEIEKYHINHVSSDFI